MPDERYIVIKVAYDRYPSYGRSLAWVAPELREAGLSMVEDHSLAPSPSRTWTGSVDGPTFERFADAWHLDVSSSVTDEEQAAAREYTFDGMNWEAGGESPIVYVRVRVGVKHEAGRSLTPSTAELVALGAPIVLRDGSRVRLRQGHSSDRELLLGGFERLSPESRYRRFLAVMPALGEESVRYLTEIDHHDHEVIAALDESGEGIGVARYVCNPQRPDVAEVAVTVIDDWQGKGLGTLLLEVLGARARAEGITSFTALMLASNQEMMRVLEALGPVRVVDRDVGTVEIEMPIPEVGLSPTLKKLLGVAARTNVVVPLEDRNGVPTPRVETPLRSGR